MKNKQELIAAIYASTLSQPDVFEYIQKLDSLLFGIETDEPENTSSPNKISNVEVDTDLIEHIKLTAKIQLEMGRKTTSDNKPFQSVINAIPNPCFIFDNSGEQIASNALAQKTTDLAGQSINEFLSDNFVRTEVEQYLSNSRDHEMLALPFTNKDFAKPITLLVKKIVGGTSTTPDNGQYLVSIIDFGFDQKVSSQFSATYGLTKSESEVAILLAQGNKAKDIAKLREVSDQTVRSQIKSIKAKTSAPDIPSLVRLLCGFSAGILVPSMLLNQPMSSAKGLVDELRGITLSDGRKFCYAEQGATDGFPVLHIHNSGYGAELTKDAISAAKSAGLRLIAPYRAGVGDSDRFDSRNTQHFLDQCAEDNLELLDALGIDKVIVAGMGVGASHALRFALRHPERVQKLVGVGKPPAWKDKWLSQMPFAQRFTMRVATKLPLLLPIIISVYGSFFDRDLSGNVMKNGLRESPVDLKSLDDPILFDLLMKSVKYNFKQDTSVYVKDTFIAATDCTADAISCPHKFHMLHGDLDGIINIEQSIEFSKDVPGTSLEIVPNAGSHIYYTHWQVYLKTLEKLAYEILAPAA